MSENLFTPGSQESWHQSAIAGGYFCHPYVFREGYYMAAEILISSALTDGPRSNKSSFLFHPICYNYRHYIELSLKNLIIKSETLYNLLKELNSTHGEITESVIPKLIYKHQINTLSDWLNERIKFISGTGLDKNLRHKFIQLNDFDPDGQNFRYPQRTNGTQSLPIRFNCDLDVLRKGMEEIHTYLSGINDWLDNDIQSASECLYELQQQDDWHCDCF